MERNAAPSIKKNYIFNSLQTVTNLLFPLVSFAYVSRVLGPELFGRVAFALSFSGYFILMACLGIPLYGSREIAKARGNREALDRVFSELFVINFLSTVCSVSLYTVCIFLIARMHRDIGLFLVTGGAVLVNMITVDWLFQGVENYRSITVRNMVGKGIALVLLFLCVKRPSDYIWYAALGVLAAGMSGVWGVVQGLRRVTFAMRGLSLRRHMKPIFLLFSSAVAASIYVYLDSVMLGFWAGDRFVGLYNSAIKIDRTAVSLITAMGVVLIPRISYCLENNDMAEYKRIAERSISFVYFLCFPLMAGLLVLAPQVVTVLAGRGFADAIVTVRIAAPLLLIMGISNFVGLQILFPNGGERMLFFATFAAAIVDLSLNVVLIPLIQHNGAAIASVSAELTALLLLAAMGRKKYLHFSFFGGRPFWYCMTSAAMGCLVYVVSKAVGRPLPALVLAAAAGAAFYCGVLRLFNDEIVKDILAAAARTLRRFSPAA